MMRVNLLGNLDFESEQSMPNARAFNSYDVHYNIMIPTI